MERPRVNAYSWPNPSIRDTVHAQCTEGLHFSKIALPINSRLTSTQTYMLSFSDKLWDNIYTVLNLPNSSIGCGLMDKNAHTRS